MVATYRRNPRVIALFLAPSLVIYGLFLVIPIIASLVLAFYDWPGIPGAPFDFTAFKNFRIVLSYPQFWESVRHILWWIILTLLTQIPIGFLLANLFCSRFRGYSIVKSIVFLPQVISVTAIGMLWYFILQPQGVLNAAIALLGLPRISRGWLSDAGTAMTSVILVNTWIGIGFHMTVFFAAISGISESILDANRLDGVRGIAKLVNMTIPLTWNALRIAIVIAVTQSLRAFDLVFVMTEGGPNGLTQVPATLLYRESFRFQRFGVGSTIGLFILLLSLAITLLSLRLLRRENVEYSD